jgi:hypothetical protein
MIAVAVFALLVADLGLAYKILTSSFGAGALTDVGWVVGWLVLMNAAMRPIPAERPRAEDPHEPGGRRPWSTPAP